MTAFTPKTSSLTAKVLHFFNVNPEETLTAHDISLKFDVQHAGVHTRLAKAIAAGMLMRDLNGDGEVVYYHPHIGKATPAPQPEAKPVPAVWPYAVAEPKATERMAKAAKATGKPRKETQRLPALNSDELDYSEDIPLPARRVVISPDKHGHIFKKLAKVGMSVAVPDSYESTLRGTAARIKRQQGGEFSIRRTPTGQLRIWRTK